MSDTQVHSTWLQAMGFCFFYENGSHVSSFDFINILICSVNFKKRETLALSIFLLVCVWFYKDGIISKCNTRRERHARARALIKLTPKGSTVP